MSAYKLDQPGLFPERTNTEYLLKKKKKKKKKKGGGVGKLWKEEHRNYHLIVSVFKCLSELDPPSMCNYFTLVSDSHKLNTRSCTLGKIRPMKPSLEYGRRSFQYREALLGTTCIVQSIFLCHSTLSFQIKVSIFAIMFVKKNLHIVLEQVLLNHCNVCHFASLL